MRRDTPFVLTPEQEQRRRERLLASTRRGRDLAERRAATHDAFPDGYRAGLARCRVCGLLEPHVCIGEGRRT